MQETVAPVLPNRHKERNQYVDVVRGLAILIVMLGHTIFYDAIIEYENNLLFKIVFSLQMPLFMLISGYVTVYTKPINSFRALMVFLRKRTVAYLLPWFMWSIPIRGILYDGWNAGNILSKIKYLLWHMDAGFWFLFSIWTICLIWGIGTYLAHKVSSAPIKNAVFTTLFSIILSLGLVALALKCGLGFLGAKLSLYYLPFFFVGYLYSRIYPLIRERRWFCTAKDITVFICLVVYIITIVFFNTYLAQETVTDIFVRMICSLSGCVLLLSVVNQLYERTKNTRVNPLNNLLALAGRYSLELYVVHFFFCIMIKLPQGTHFTSLLCFGTCLSNYILMAVASCIVIYVLHSNRYSRFLLFGKK